MHSIQSRLAVGLFLSLLLLLSIQWIVVGISIRQLAENYIASQLIQDSETLLASLSLSHTGTTKLNKTKLGLIFSQPFSGLYYKVSTANAEFRSRSLWDTDLQHKNITRQKNTHQIVSGPQQQTLLQVTRVYNKNSKQIIISIAKDLTVVYKDITWFQIRYSIVTLVVAIILLIIQAVIIKKNLKPLDKIRRELKSLDQGLLQQLHENVPSEVLPLVRELNLQLKSFEKRIDRSRNATANLAHNLKTPLSILYQLIDAPVLHENKSLKSSLLRSIKTIEKNISRELKRSTIVGRQLTARSFEIEPEIKSLVETLYVLYKNKKLKITYCISQKTYCNIEQQDLMEMLGNIMDNACKWASEEVLLTINSAVTDLNNEQQLIFIVEDDGLGCSQDEMLQLTIRGKRFDEYAEGDGLGLSIVRDIVKDYHGLLSISVSAKLGGLCVQINIPYSKA